MSASVKMITGHGLARFGSSSSRRCRTVHIIKRRPRSLPGFGFGNPKLLRQLVGKNGTNSVGPQTEGEPQAVNPLM